jgi:hypothetical protein
VVLRLLNELGFDGVDAGGLDESWRQQPGSPVYAKSARQNGVRLQTVLGTLRSRLNAIYRVRREFEIGQYPVAAIGNDVDKSNCEAGVEAALKKLKDEK